MKRLRSSWHAILTGVLMMLLCVVTSYLFIQELQIKNSHLKPLLNSTHQNSSECGHMTLLIDAMLYNFTSLSAEKTKLSLLLQNISQEKAQLSLDLKNTLQDKTQLEEENRELFLNSTIKKELNKQQQSILFSNKLSFLWRLCDRNTLQCSRCLPGWVEHASRCFLLSKDTKKWEKARSDCLNMGADMAVVLNADDQAFLTNMTFQFVQQHPEEQFHSAWIGLQDMVMENDFFWVTGQRIHPNVTYWISGEPNNIMASWDNSGAGQDCVAIVPPTSTETQGWLNSWDDIICAGKRHYLCETTALSVT
ncbi:C-type lectin domain family 4 member C-like [Pagrus major]|uniref:C-type lectin domain family 4 member C-like n=1 Tax=Pagrus major TaxID=143350 RepID=UPI003CC852D6